jgi:hypothetical protein
MSNKIRAYAAFNKTLRLSRGLRPASPDNLTPKNSRSDCLSLSRHAKILNFRLTHFLYYSKAAHLVIA